MVESWGDIPKDVQNEIQSSLDIIESREAVPVGAKGEALEYLFQQHGIYLGGRYSGNAAAKTCGTCVSNVKIGFKNLIRKWQINKR